MPNCAGTFVAGQPRMRWICLVGFLVVFPGSALGQDRVPPAPHSYQGQPTPARVPPRVFLPTQIADTDPNPMEGLSLAGPRAQVGLGFGLFASMAPGPLIAADSGDGIGLGIAYGIGAAVALGLGIWGAVRLKARRVERRERWESLPTEVALRQPDVKRGGPTAMTIIGAVSTAGGLFASTMMTLQLEEPAGLLMGLPNLALGALLMGLGIRRLKQRRAMRTEWSVAGLRW